MMSNFTITRHKWIEPHAKTTMHSTKVSRFCFLTAGRGVWLSACHLLLLFTPPFWSTSPIIVGLISPCFFATEIGGPCWPFWPIASAQKYQETQNAIANDHIGGSKSKWLWTFLGGNWGFHPVGTPHSSSYLIAILLPTPQFRTQVSNTSKLVLHVSASPNRSHPQRQRWRDHGAKRKHNISGVTSGNMGNLWCSKTKKGSKAFPTFQTGFFPRFAITSDWVHWVGFLDSISRSIWFCTCKIDGVYSCSKLCTLKPIGFSQFLLPHSSSSQTLEPSCSRFKSIFTCLHLYFLVAILP